VVRPGRWGQAQAVLGITDPNMLLFPIPSQEITLSKGVLTQNPGYTEKFMTIPSTPK
jgi:hypothetical protein